MQSGLPKVTASGIKTYFFFFFKNSGSLKLTIDYKSNCRLFTWCKRSSRNFIYRISSNLSSTVNRYCFCHSIDEEIKAQRSKEPSLPEATTPVGGKASIYM